MYEGSISPSAGVNGLDLLTAAFIIKTGRPIGRGSTLGSGRLMEE